MNEVNPISRKTVDRLLLPAPLHSYQWEGVSFLYRAERALLADEMGLGKTVQVAVTLALLMNETSQVNRVLIVAPASLTTNWMVELERWAPAIAAQRVQGNAQARSAFYLLPIPVIICSYEQIRSDGFDRIPAGTFDLVVLDEAQRIKNRQSATSLACRLLPRRRAWALSATPFENCASDVSAILSFLEPEPETEQSNVQLRKRLENIMLRRLKRDVRAELPPVIVQDISLELTSGQRVAYDKLWRDRISVANTDPGKTMTVLLGLVTRLKIICNYDAITGTSTKLEVLKTIIDSAGKGSRIIIFSQFVRTLQWLSERLGTQCDFLIGSMSASERDAAIKCFKEKNAPRALLISIRAGGVGINLGSATHVILFDRWWNPAVENQAIYRAHRFDRYEPLHVIRFVVTSTIEERISKILEHKQAEFDDIIEEASRRRYRPKLKDIMDILGLSSADLRLNLPTKKES